MPRIDNPGKAGLSDEDWHKFLAAYERGERNQYEIAKLLAADKVSRSGVQHRIRRAKELGYIDEDGLICGGPVGFRVEIDLPVEVPSEEELLERRRRDFARKKAAKEARRLIPVRVTMDGPIGIAHMGDPHVDDDGTDIEELERHVALIRDTDGLFGANVGDLQNNWVGRLARLYGQQSTSAAEAWVLVEWLVKAVPWLYLIGGNHDAWSGAGDPLKWIARDNQGVIEYWGARLNLKFPNGREIRVNARHDFAGHSQWNAAHGVGKAVQMGWRDHILTCGHKHTSGLMHLKCPATGLLSWAIRVGSYKVFDRYAEEKGLPDQSAFRCPVTVINPQYGDDDPRLISVFLDPEQGADYLTFLRRNAA